MKLYTKVSQLNRVGGVLERKLRHLGIETVEDLLFYFPFRYEDYSTIVSIAQLQEGLDVTVQGKIELIANKRSPRKRTMITEAVVVDDSDRLRVIWFGQPFIAKTLKAGDQVSLSGKVKSDMFGMQMVGPTYEKIRNPKSEIRNTETAHTARIVPIYSLTTGITHKQIRFLMKQAVGAIDSITEWLPDDLRDTVDVMGLAEAIKAIHFPESQEELQHAERRLKFDELFILQLRAEMLRQSIKKSTAPVLQFREKEIKLFVSSLPFSLTKDQKIASWDILQDIQKPEPMNRLLEGDVGSGKTVVAGMSLYNTALNGYQGVLMAPTEILGIQHYQSLCALFGDTMTISLVTRSQFLISNSKFLNKSEIKNNKLLKQTVVECIKNGNVDIIIGTHALLSESVEFKNLGLVIVDEQHRFGVEQRRRLARTNAGSRGLTQTDEEQMQNKVEDVKDNFLYGDLTYKIRGCIFEVKKNIGLGHKEIIYENALVEEFKKNGIAFEKEKIIDVVYEGKKIGVYRPDFVIDSKIIIELKSLSFVGQREKKQVWTYLKGSSYKLALLVNFAHGDVEIERIVYDTARPGLKEDIENERSAFSQRQSALVPHFLSMTATPIPRSFALTLYGDLDLSIIREMPKDRKPVKTRLVDPHNRQKAYEFIAEQVEQGRQVFVICPLIEEKNSLETKKVRDVEISSISNFKFPISNLSEKKSVMTEYEKLSTQIFPDLHIGYLHGKMKSQEKDQTMKQFADGELDILVSTSVVEVGVNIPNASVMMIEGADRFGLAQLHQFRGRVGRSSHQSYCFLFTDNDSDKVKKRLSYFEKTTDGFAVAEYDLEQRGPGEVYGTAQSGMMNFKLATLKDHELIKLARDVARGIDFNKYPSLKEKVEEWERNTHLE